MHKGHTHPVNNEATPSTNGTTAARPLGGAAGSARTTSSFTTHSVAPASTPSTFVGNDGSTREPNHGNGGAWGSFGNPGQGGLDGGGFGGSGSDQGHAGGRSLGGGRTNRDIGETITVTLLPDKEGMFMFQHRNYEVKSARRGSTVIRRYSDFVWLLDCLHKRYPFRQLPLLPPKRVAGNMVLLLPVGPADWGQSMEGILPLILTLSKSAAVDSSASPTPSLSILS